MYSAPSGDTNLLMKVQAGYGPDATNNGNVMSQQVQVGASAFSASQIYTYEPLNRIDVAQEGVSGANWKQTYGYDRWGNRWMIETGTSGFDLTGVPNDASWYSAGNNRMTGGNYDSVGEGAPPPGGAERYRPGDRSDTASPATA